MDESKLLLIEDSEEGQLVVKSSLSQSGISITSALTFQQAKQYIDQASFGEFDIILLDLVLPDGDGMGLFEQIIQNPNLRNTPVVMLTGKDDIFNKIQAFELGLEEYLVKPVNPLELKTRVEDLLKKRKKKLS